MTSKSRRIRATFSIGYLAKERNQAKRSRSVISIKRLVHFGAIGTKRGGPPFWII